MSAPGGFKSPSPVRQARLPVQSAPAHYYFDTNQLSELSKHVP